MAKISTPAQGDEIIVHVPKGCAGLVRVVEIDPKEAGRDVTVQVSRERKIQESAVIGVIVK